MPDFMPVLLIAVILFVGLLIVFGGDLVYAPSESHGNRYFPSDRTIEFNNFEVYYTSSEERAGYVGGEVSNGIFAKEDKKIGFQVSRPDEVSEALLDLKVWNTNYYGRFIVLVNGKEVYEGYPPVGEKLISFDKSLLKDDNILEIMAESSGWRIWAPTVYSFDLNTEIDYLGKKTQSFTFDLNDQETKYMTKARIVVFGDRTGTGNLKVRINGEEIYSGLTTAYQDFPTSVLLTGNNTIDFSTEPNTTYRISSAQVIVFFE
jgi:hypothetical protein